MRQSPTTPRMGARSSRTPFLSGVLGAQISDSCANRIGPCDVTKKEDLEKLVQDISKEEKHLNLLSKHNTTQR